MNAAMTSKNGFVQKNGNRFSRIQFIRTCAAFFVTIATILPDGTSDKKQYRYEINQEEAALKFAADWVK